MTTETTTTTETTELEALKAELASLKEAKEVQETPAPQVTPTPETKTDNNVSETLEYMAKVQDVKDIQTARVRGWGYFVGAYFTGPIWPAVIANRTGEWTPFWVGLGLGVVSLPFAFLDLGIISSVPAAGVGTAMMASKSKDKRRQLGIVSPEQADVKLFSRGF